MGTSALGPPPGGLQHPVPEELLVHPGEGGNIDSKSQNVLELLAAECKEVRVRVGTSKSEAEVLSGLGSELLPQARETKSLRFLLTSEEDMECEINALVRTC